ncbi:DUF397 domain-containing protein [Streptomyces sp. NPDC090085]|uniref:DUF397 domain-containing protein n=1 Tax=Streptomyces sp. NPDC090085 TaxID=3365943 RepID=UPI00382BFE88
MNEHTIPDASFLTGWRKSTYSGNEGGSCVEILDSYRSGVPVRDSKVPHGPAIVFAATGWASFIAALQGGELTA